MFHRWGIGGLLIVLLVCLNACEPTSIEKENPTLAQGDGIKVGRQDVANSTRGQVERAEIRGENRRVDIESEGLADLIERQLLRNEAKRLGLMEQIQRSVDAEVTSMLKRYPSAEDRKRFFQLTGVDEAVFRERCVDRFVLSEICRSTGLKKNTPKAAPAIATPVRRNYPNGMLVVQLIEVPLTDETTPQDREKARKRIAELTQAWRNEEDAPNAMKELQGQFHFKRGAFSKKNVPEQFKPAVEVLKVGEYSDVIEKGDGLFVFRLVDMGELASRQKERHLMAAKRQLEDQQEKWNAYISELKTRYNVKLVEK